ncbi:hypothetical protein HDU79_008892 [Rhizoclosmatium sp. JEL0117]|nr:hypothetical protein HDU79_008892 [Rhizoclosmatium sp. JEL0117]
MALLCSSSVTSYVHGIESPVHFPRTRSASFAAPPTTTLRPYPQISRIPIELIQDIFRRLDPATVLKYRRLCRHIAVALSDPHFAILNLNHHPEKSTASLQSYKLWFVWPESYQAAYAGRLSVNELKLGWKGIKGSLPRALGSLKSLTILTLHENKLSGPIPLEICSLVNLSILHLQGNKLSGAIPSEIGNLTQLTQLCLQSNKLTGGIPREIGKLNKLENLSLNCNQLTGEIPPEIKGLKALKSLYLEQNMLYGNVPSEIEELGTQEGIKGMGNFTASRF